MAEFLNEEENAQWWLFLHASPMGVDTGTPLAISARVASELPENIRRMLWDEKTSSRIYLAGQKHQLSDEQIQETARIIRDIAMGEVSPARFREVLEKQLNVSPQVAQSLSSTLTKDLISPNYFQIAQVYERNQQKKSLGRGRLLPPSGPRDNRAVPSSSGGPLPPRPVSLPPTNLVDLRRVDSGAPSPRRSPAPPSSPPPGPPPPPSSPAVPPTSTHGPPPPLTPLGK